VCFGHSGDNNHGVDEWTDVDSVIQSTKVLAVMIIKWCGVAQA
jgi:acetylornithine deacetylase